MKQIQKENKICLPPYNRLDRQEQYSKRNCMLINGFSEIRNENTHKIVIEALKEKMGEEIEEVELDGTCKDDKVRPSKVKKKKTRIIDLLKFSGVKTS